MGTLMVFGGTTGTVRSLLSLFTTNSAQFEWTANLVGATAGVIAAVYVRKQVKKRPPYVSNTPFGWWP